MKANRIEHGRRTWLVVIGSIVILCAIAICIRIGYNRLKDLYLEQCVIRNMTTQVEITSGKMVHPSTVAEEFGLKVGRNLAEIDFARKREEVLAKIPNLLTIKVTRKLPDKVFITAVERTPIARMGIRGDKRTTGRVVDSEGMVFLCQRGTQALPTIYENAAPGTHPGQKIKRRTLAALRLIEACRDPDLTEFRILEVDTSKRDFLIATLSNYSRVKILWDDMDAPSARTEKDLQLRLARLRDAIRSKVAPETVIWNATMPDMIFADTQGEL